MEWVLAGLTCALYGLLVRKPISHRILRALGLGLMTVPAWRIFESILPRVAAPFVGGVEHPVLSSYQLSGMYLSILMGTLLYLAAGFVLWAWADPRVRRTTQVKEVARVLRETGIPLGRGEAHGMAIGLAAFPLLALANVVLLLVSAGIANSDVGVLWSRMDLARAGLISLAAGFTEELLYRGLVFVGVARLVAKVHPGSAWPLAWFVQAVFFGFAHAGYASLQQLTFATLFGLLAGLVAWRFGIWTAIVLHVLIDVVAFVRFVPDIGWSVVALILACNVAFAVAWLTHAWNARRTGTSAQREI